MTCCVRLGLRMSVHNVPCQARRSRARPRGSSSGARTARSPRSTGAPATHAATRHTRRGAGCGETTHEAGQRCKGATATQRNSGDENGRGIQRGTHAANKPLFVRPVHRTIVAVHTRRPARGSLGGPAHVGALFARSPRLSSFGRLSHATCKSRVHNESRSGRPSALTPLRVLRAGHSEMVRPAESRTSPYVSAERRPSFPTRALHNELALQY